MKITQCMDGIDNDGDGCVDLWDFGCSSYNDDSENTKNSGGVCRPGCETYGYSCLKKDSDCSTFPSDPKIIYPCPEGYFCCVVV